MNMIDQAKKHKLIEHIKNIGFANNTETILTIAEYFDGYDADWCTICANNSRRVSTREFKEFLYELKTTDLVHDAFIRFYDFSDALENEEEWINSDMVFLVTKAQPDEVEKWFEHLEGSDAYEDSNFSTFVNLPPIPDGYKLVGIGWD